MQSAGILDTTTHSQSYLQL